MNKKYEKPSLIFDQLYPPVIRDLIDDMQLCTNEDGMMVLEELLARTYKVGFTDAAIQSFWLNQ